MAEKLQRLASLTEIARPTSTSPSSIKRKETLCAVIIACQLTLFARGHGLGLMGFTPHLTDAITLPYPADRSEIDRRRNSVDLVKPGKEKGAVVARIQITTETRRDHAEALRRLREIAVEEKEVPQFVVIAGWPALERRRIAPLARTGREIVRKTFFPFSEQIQTR